MLGFVQHLWVLLFLSPHGTPSPHEYVQFMSSRLADCRSVCLCVCLAVTLVVTVNVCVRLSLRSRPSATVKASTSSGETSTSVVRITPPTLNSHHIIIIVVVISGLTNRNQYRASSFV